MMQDTSSHRFESHAALARLPYFELSGGRLRLAHAELGPVIDMHTHLALGYLGRPRLDLERSWRRTRHYLPEEGPVDLDCYANRNFSPRDLRRMKLDLSLLSVTGRGMRRTHTAPNLLRDMADLGIRASVILPIDLPLISDNAGAYLGVAARHEGLIGFGSVHPYDPAPERALRRQKARGARGIKLHPMAQMVRPDNPRTVRLCGLCGELGLVVLFHCGPVGIEPRAGRRRSQVALYERPIAECPRTTFLLGHAGALQLDEGIAMARRYPNVWLELASQSLPGVRQILEQAPGDRIVFGTDWPFYHQASGLAKVLLATEGAPAARRAVLHDNAARLLGLEAAARPREARLREVMR